MKGATQLSMDLQKLTTEARNPDTMDLDIMSPLEVVTVMNREDAKVPQVISTLLPQIAQAVEWAISSLKAGGRVFYIGAGTSGRLGVLDAAECPPTFGVSPDLIVGLIAGGEKAFIKAVEGAEDNLEQGKEDLAAYNLCPNDLVIGIAASGRTPYVIGGLTYARETGCRTVAISCNKDSEISKVADLAIEAVVGPEVLTGSTRLKAGTAQKLILNMISTAAMVGIGKAYQNLMVDVVPSNEKLCVRAEKIVMEATGVDHATARAKITEAEGSVKTAITMILANCSAEEARERLNRARGHVRKAIR